MSNIIEEAEIINMYLCQIKKSLPLGIRLKKDELNDILDEIEEHIWEIAIENAGQKEPNEIDVQIAISQMGTPQDIASKFTNRSTPYIYISEELYPAYKKYRKIIFWSSVLSLIIYTLFFSNLFYFESSIYFYEILIILLIYFTSIIINGVVFCYLSITGYIPYELRKSKMQKRYSNIAQIQKPKFKSHFQILVIGLEISFFLINAIFIAFWAGLFATLFLFSIIKILRGFTKTKSVMWQRSLILVDIILIAFLIGYVETQLYLQSNVRFYFYSDLIPDFIYIIYILWTLFILYIYYEVYLFITLKEKLERYLKELSLIKRINKKEIILGTLKNHDTSKTLNITRNKQTLSIKSSEINVEYEEVIKTYLNKAKSKLPFWLKKEEKRDVIKNLEDEIREGILEFEESSVLPHEKLNDFLSNLGSIKAILSEYKQRGIPKIYISKELWLWYLTALKSVLTYFILISAFITVLQISYTASFTFFSFFSYFIGFWFFWILILILATQLFTFLSLNDIIPEKSEILGTKKNKTPKYNLYNIWEATFAVVFVYMATVLIFLVFFGKFSTNFPGSNLIFTISGFLLLLAVLKILKIVFKRKKVILKSFVIILSLVFSLVINFIIIYNSSSEYPLIYTIPASTLLNLLFLPINIEIIYETFHFFFKNKKLYEIK